MIQVHYIYYALYFYYYISSTSDYQALDPKGWGAPPTGGTIFLLLLLLDVSVEALGIFNFRWGM